MNDFRANPQIRESLMISLIACHFEGEGINDYCRANWEEGVMWKVACGPDCQCCVIARFGVCSGFRILHSGILKFSGDFRLQLSRNTPYCNVYRGRTVVALWLIRLVRSICSSEYILRMFLDFPSNNIFPT